MEFDKTRVYTAVNAEDLKFGSKCVFANTIQDLKDSVQAGLISTLIDMLDESVPERFIGSDGYVEITYSLAYLIEPPNDQKELEYKPFESVDKAMEAIKAHGGWVKCGGSGREFLVTGCGTNKEDYAVYITSDWISLEELFKDYVFVNDGSPCGELVEQ